MKEVLKVPLKATLYHHQQSACRFACERFGILPSEIHSNGVALLMEMGCGKTITSIAIVGILYQYRHIRRILITAPLSILSVWEQEFARFAAFPYQLTILKGSSTQKKEQLSKLHGDGLQIAVVNYESAWRLERKNCLPLMPTLSLQTRHIRSRKTARHSPKPCTISETSQDTSCF